MSVPGAQLFGTTNPDNPAHWVKRRYRDRLDQLPDWRSFTFTLDDNPALEQSYKDSVRRDYTGLRVSPLHPRRVGRRRVDPRSSWL
jgi:hypothetical protein